MVGGEDQRRVVQGREGRVRSLLRVQREGRGEQPLEAVLGLPVGVVADVHCLDHTDRGLVAVLRKERDRALEDDVALAVLDGDDGRVAVADQVDLGAAHLQRLVDLDRGLRLLAARARPVADVGAEGARGALLGAAARVRGVEAVQLEAEGVQVVSVVEGARLEVVVLGERVVETVALDDQLAALGLEQPAHREGDQQSEQGDVEQQVAGLAQEALLRRDRRAGGLGAEAAAAQQALR